MNPFALIPLKDWLYLGAIVAIVALGALWTHHEREIGKTEGMNYVQGKWDKAVREDQAAKAAEVQRVEVAQTKVDHVEIQSRAADAAAAVRANTSLGRLQQRVAALGACPVPGPATAAAASAPASAPADLRADVLRRLGQAAGQLAAFGDSARTAGLDTEGHYDALRPATASSAATP